MEVVLGSGTVTVFFFALFFLAYKVNKTGLMSGFLFDVFLLCFVITLYLFAMLHPENIFLLYPVVAIAIVGIIVLLFGLYILLVFLFLNARTVFKKEGRSLANSLTLIAAVGIIALLIISWVMVDQTTPLWLQALWAGVMSTVSVYSMTVMIFLTTALLCLFARPKPDKDFIIILGSGLIDGKVTPLLGGRISRAISFARKQHAKTGKLPMLLMSGGQGPDEPITEAEAMATYAVAAGFEADHVLTETASTNTAENMAFSKAIMESCAPEGYRAIYATSDYHVMRAGIYARKAGLKIDGIGARTAWYYVPNALLREFIAYLSLHKRRFITVVVVLFALAALASGLPYYLINLLT